MTSSNAKSGQGASSQTQAKPHKKPTPEVADGLRALLVNELKDIYWAEKALITAIPKMIKNATAPELIKALTGHLAETEQQIKRLEQAFTAMGEKAEAKKCEAMAGLLKEAEEIMGDCEKGHVRDAGIILAGQKVEHYEIATYGTLRTFADTLGNKQVSELLQATLNEEKGADEKLTYIAESFINQEAV